MFFIPEAIMGFRTGKFQLLLICMLLFGSVATFGQQADTANKIKITIANSGVIEHFKTDTGSFNKFISW